MKKSVAISIAAGVVIYLQGALNRFAFINSDEANSVKYAHFSLVKMIRELTYDAHFPLYPLLLKCVDIFVGINQWSAYLVNASILALMIQFMFYERSNAKIRVALSALFLLNPYFLELFTEIRPYPLFIAALCVMFTTDNPKINRVAFVALAVSHHLGFATAAVVTLFRKKPLFELVTLAVLAPLFVVQTISVVSESRYASTFSVTEELARLSTALEFFLRTPQLTIPFLIAVVIAIANSRKPKKLLLLAVPAASIFAIAPAMLNLQYLVGLMTAFIALFASMTIVWARKPLIGWITLAAVIAMTTPAALTAYEGDESQYKLNYAAALDHGHANEIILATFGIRGASTTAVELEARESRAHVTDLFDDYATGLYKSNDETTDKLRQKLAAWFAQNPGREALLVYSSGPFPHLFDGLGLRVVDGPWSTEPGDLVSVILSSK